MDAPQKNLHALFFSNGSGNSKGDPGFGAVISLPRKAQKAQKKAFWRFRLLRFFGGQFPQATEARLCLQRNCLSVPQRGSISTFVPSNIP
jgi:hypothetical protein